jgi:ABC-type uncharacterized transport system involved in gliding motility auxiliary subunit
MRSAAIGKIAGAIGLLLFLSSSYTYFITTGSPWLAGGKAISGLVLIAAYLATNYKQFGQFASRKSTFFFVSTAVATVLVIAGLGAVNYVAAKKNKTWDLTRKKIYTLAPQTTSTLQGLGAPVQAIGFMASSHPDYGAWQDLLERYRGAAPEKFEYTFKDPRKHPDLAARYQLREGQSTVILTRGEGEQQAHAPVSVISEQELTNALIKLNGAGEQKVYFLAGHGEWLLEADPSEREPSVSELRASLAHEGYQAEPLNLAGQAEVPKDAALLVIAGAKSRISENEVAAIRRYLDEGGRVLYFAELGAEPGLDEPLAAYGVQVDPGVVADLQFAVGSPYVVLSLFYGEHEMTRMHRRQQLNLELPTTRGLSVVREGLADGVVAQPVVFSSPFAWVETTPNNRPEPNDGEKTGQIPLVVASTRNTAAAENKRFDEARLVVFGDSELLVDANWGHEPNRNLVMNAFAWASTQAEKITIRPPDRDISTLDLDRATLARIRFLATDLLPVGLLGIGLAIWLTRRNK